MRNNSNKLVKHCSTDGASWLRLFFKRLGKETAVSFCWLLCSRSTVETHRFSEGRYPKCFHSNMPSNSPNAVVECHCFSQTGSGEPEWSDSWQTWGFGSASALALAVSRTKWKGDLDKIFHRLLGQRALLTSSQSFAHKSSNEQTDRNYYVEDHSDALGNMTSIQGGAKIPTIMGSIVNTEH